MLVKGVANNAITRVTNEGVRAGIDEPLILLARYNS
jgi:hypothetical protein